MILINIECPPRICEISLAILNHITGSKTFHKIVDGHINFEENMSNFLAPIVPVDGLALAQGHLKIQWWASMSSVYSQVP